MTDCVGIGRDRIPQECSFGSVVQNCRSKHGRAENIMVQPLNLLAREDFRTGDPGYVLGESVRLGDDVRKLTGAGLPRVAIRVTALEDIEAWTNGQFQEATPTRGQRTVKRTTEAIERDSAMITHSHDLRGEAAELNRTAKDVLSSAARLKKDLAKQKRP